MTVAILTECALSPIDGTGAQMLLMFKDRPDVPIIHFYLTHGYGGFSSHPRSFRLEDPRYTGRGKRFAGPFEKALGLNWWNGSQIDTRKFGGLREKHQLACDVAYVLFTDEKRAGQMNSILHELGVPYVAHSMDLYHDDGLHPDRMPQLATLVRGAKTVIAISEPIRLELEKFGVPVTVLPFGKVPFPQTSRPPEPGKPVKLLVAGRHYLGGLELLAKAWPILKQKIPQLRLVAAGNQTRFIPEALRADLDDRGFIPDDADYQALLGECHIGFLSGPNELDRFGRYSIPSRSGDFLMAGLPVIAALAAGSATEQFMRPLIPQAVRTVNDIAGITDAMLSFVDPVNWLAASGHGRAFALEKLSLANVRESIFEALGRAASHSVKGEGTSDR